MTQYRVNARNCEAKRLHTEAYVACGCGHVGAARQRYEPLAGTPMDYEWRADRGRVRAQAGVPALHYGKLSAVSAAACAAIAAQDPPATPKRSTT